MIPNLVNQAEGLFREFLPQFLGTAFGSMQKDLPLICIQRRLQQRLAITDLFRRTIDLNLQYFNENSERLAHTIFHEMTHIWLYDCFLDPRHTQKFYDKMQEFPRLGYKIDPNLFQHKKATAENPVIYRCPNCSNRWYLRRKLTYSIYCGQCFDQCGVVHCAHLTSYEQLVAKQELYKAS